MNQPLSRPPKVAHNFRRVALLFAGGPAPAANAVISTCAASFLKNNIEVLGILHGYSNLEQFGSDHPMREGEDYVVLDTKFLQRTRNTQGIMVGTARANPGRDVSSPEHLKDAERTVPLRNVYEALCSLEVDALISIGGDDTLKTANKIKLYQDGLDNDAKRIPVVHLPKTIDNDYEGIDFTFGYFTAVETLANEIRNLLADSEANQSYFLAETMGRSAGWLGYGAAIAGEASLTISVEDIIGSYRDTEIVTQYKRDTEGNVIVGEDGLPHEEPVIDPHTNEPQRRDVMVLEKVVDRICRTMQARQDMGKAYGVIVLAEGLAELLPASFLKGIARDEHGHISVAHVNMGQMFARLVAKRYEEQTGCKRKITGVQLGYESRCSKPHAFDVILGSQLGVGAYRALVEQRLDGVMVSASGQFNLRYVPFEELVDPATLVTKVRHIKVGSDFHRLARFLEVYVNE